MDPPSTKLQQRAPVDRGLEPKGLIIHLAHYALATVAGPIAHPEQSIHFAQCTPVVQPYKTICNAQLSNTRHCKTVNNLHCNLYKQQYFLCSPVIKRAAYTGCVALQPTSCWSR
eukprot:scaffold218779_cov15-Tisochrysis_lutea.AAC.1